MDLNSLIGLLLSGLIGLSGFALRQMKADLDAALTRIEARQVQADVKLDSLSDDVSLLRVRLHETGTLPWAM